VTDGGVEYNVSIAIVALAVAAIGSGRLAIDPFFPWGNGGWPEAALALGLGGIAGRSRQACEPALPVSVVARAGRHSSARQSSGAVSKRMACLQLCTQTATSGDEGWRAACDAAIVSGCEGE
jgi:hypothetical protein